MRRSGDRATLPAAFLWFWSAEAVSGVGTYVSLVALQTIVVLTLGGGATETGMLSAARWLPYLVLGIVVGALVDRARRKPVMVWTDAARAVLLAAVPVLWIADALTLPALLGIVVAIGLASVANDAASMAVLPRIVPRAQLQPAHARIDGADAVAQMGGPALGGALVRVLGGPLAVLVQAATHVYAAVVVARLDVDDRAPERRAAPSILREMGEGVRWVYGRSGLAPLATATHVWFLGNAVLGTVFAPFALIVLGLGPEHLGVALACAGVGALVGASITTAVGARLGTGWTIITCHALSAVAVVVMLVALWQPGLEAWGATAVLGAGQALHGTAMGMSNSHEMSFRQLLTPDALQGRVNITMRSINRAVIVVAAPLGGVLADLAGTGWALWACVAAFLVAAGMLAVGPFRTARTPV